MLKDTASRVPSSLSIRQRTSGDFRHDGSAPSTPIQGRSRRCKAAYDLCTDSAVPYSRTTSKDTVTQLPHAAPAAQQGPSASLESRQRSGESAPRETEILTRKRSDAKSPPSLASSSRRSSSSSGTAPTQSRAFRARPSFSSKTKPKAALPLVSSADEDEDEDDVPAFLPYSEPKEPHRQRKSEDAKGKGKQAVLARDKDASVDPSTGSAQSLPSSQPPSSSVPSISSPATQPARPSQLAALSPRQRRIAQEGSEGSPSMGSSFSDLDDASLTQSALEEALAREIKAGKGSLGVVSRVGGLWKGQTHGQGQSSRRHG